MANPPQQTFPDLVGKTYEEAEEFLRENFPDLEPVKTPQGAPTTRDYRSERVRLFVNQDDVVVEVPYTG